MINENVVMITGASKGLGKEMTLAFAKQGAKLAICARTESTLLAVANEAEKCGAEVIAIPADVSKPRDVERFVSLAEKRFGKIDVLINNASILGFSPMPYLADYPDQDFAKVLDTNVLSAFYMTKRVLPGMLIKDSGHILNLTSSAGHVGYAGWGAYGVSKFAIEGLTYTWADELSETGVLIHLVDPGEMDTEMHSQAVPDCDYELNNPKDVADVIVRIVENNGRTQHGKLIEVDALFKAGDEDVNEYSNI